MRFKYFLRGLGIGVVFASLICFVAYRNTLKVELSDEKVIERAKELGMTEQENTIEKLLETEKEDNLKKSESDSKEELENKTSDKESDDGNSDNVASDKDTGDGENMIESKLEDEAVSDATEQENEEEQTETTEQENENGQTETTEQKNEEEQTNATEGIVTITIKGGDTSYPICEELQKLGVIDNAQDFDKYLISSGYAGRIRVGTHTLTIGMSYEEIAIEISDPV